MNFTPLLFTVVAGIIVALFVWWLNNEKYDLRYTLSEKIPLRFGSAAEEAVQQIEVKNLSKKPVERILLKFPPLLTTYEVSKNSQADQIEHFRNPDTEEFIYSILPPEGSFHIVFKTQGLGIARGEIRVTHSKGKATYALEGGMSTAAASTLGYLCGFGFWAIVTFFSFRSMVIDSWTSDAEYRSGWVLKRSIPFYMSNEKWADIRAKAVANIWGYDFERSDRDIEALRSYKWLNSEKPDYLSADEWDQVQKAATDRLRSSFGSHLNSIWSADQVLKFLRVKRPAQFPSDKWQELQIELQTRFLSRRATEPYKDLVVKLQETKPEGVLQADWDENQAKLAGRFAAQLYDDALVEDSPLSYLKRQNLSVLPKDTADRLLNRAYLAQLRRIPNLIIDENADKFLSDGKPEWISLDDYSTYKQKAELTVRVTKKDVLNGLLQRILLNTKLPKKDLDKLDPESQEMLTNMDSDIRLAKESNRAETERISKESQQVSSEREQVLKQLKILDDLFKDPSSIDRVGSYDNPFAAGNFELLKKVSKTFRAIDKH